MKKKNPPVMLRHQWVYHRRYSPGTHRDGSPAVVANVYVCTWCSMWTANVPLYRKQVCPAQDRRKAKQDRRS